MSRGQKADCPSALRLSTNFSITYPSFSDNAKLFFSTFPASPLAFFFFHPYDRKITGKTPSLTQQKACAFYDLSTIKRQDVNNLYTYHWYQWLAFFYLYCFFGWIFESTYVSLRKHCLINRGFLRLPLLPIYGSGAVLILWVSLPVQNSLILVYFTGMLAATMLEYVTGYMMERLFKMRYWDYSSQHFHLHGYICLSSSIAWGFLSLFLTEIIHQPISRFILSLSPVPLIIAVCIITAAFCTDAYQSTKEALALGSTLELLASIKQEMDELEAKLSVIREEAAAQATEHLNAVREEIEAQAERLSAARSETASLVSERLNAVKAETDARLEAAKLRSEQRLKIARLHSKKRLESTRLHGEQWLESAKLHSEKRLESARLHGEKRLKSTRLHGEQRLEALELRLNELKEKQRLAAHAKSRLGHFYRRQLLKGNPTASSPFADALKELKEKLL